MDLLKNLFDKLSVKLGLNVKTSREINSSRLYNSPVNLGRDQNVTMNSLHSNGDPYLELTTFSTKKGQNVEFYLENKSSFILLDVKFSIPDLGITYEVSNDIGPNKIEGVTINHNSLPVAEPGKSIAYLEYKTTDHRSHRYRFIVAYDYFDEGNCYYIASINSQKLFP